MFACVCVYVCRYAYVYTHTQAYIHIHTFINASKDALHTYKHTSIDIYVTHIHIHT